MEKVRQVLVEADQNQRPEDQSALVEQSVEELDAMGGI